MEHSEHYTQDHFIAKVIVYVLYVLVGIASIELASPYVALVIGTFVWLFGINTVAYLVECFCGHNHGHKLV